MIFARIFDPMTANLVAAQRGDERAFARVYRRLFPQVFGFLLRRLRQREVAQDLAGQVFLRVVEKLPTFDAGQGSARAWIFAIARSSWLDHLRRSAVRTLADGGDSVDHIHAAQHWPLCPQEWIEQQADAKVLAQAWLGLTADEQEILLLRIGDDLSHSEVSAVLAINSATARKRYSRALDHLRLLVASTLALPSPPVQPTELLRSTSPPTLQSTPTSLSSSLPSPLAAGVICLPPTGAADATVEDSQLGREMAPSLATREN